MQAFMTGASGCPGGDFEGPLVIETRYAQPGKQPVVALAGRGGGHTIPNPDYRFPRLMGRTDDTLDAPAVIWAFFSEASLPTGTTPRPRPHVGPGPKSG